MHVNDQVLAEGCRLFGAVGAKPLGGSEAALYEVRIGTSRYMLRFSPVNDNDGERFAARWEFVDYLSDRGVSVPARLLSANGSKTEWIIDGADGRRWALVCVEWVDGHGLDPRYLSTTDPSVLQAWGGLMGKMHAVAKLLPHDNRLGGWRQEALSFLDWCEEPPIRDRWQETIDALGSLSMDRERYGLVHNDLHYANIIVTGSTVWVVDFDVCGYHWYCCDIAVAMQAVLWTAPSAVVTDSGSWFGVFDQFMKGYREENDLQAEWEVELPAFLAYRRLLLYTVFSHEWQHPAGWQAARLGAWRRGIIENIPVLNWPTRR